MKRKRVVGSDKNYDDGVVGDYDDHSIDDDDG